MTIQNESSGRDRNRKRSAEAEADKAEVKQNPWVSTGKTFRINRVYTAGVTACGSALVGIAGAAEREGFQKVASFIHKWVCGGSSTGQTLAEIQDFCNEILNEVSSVLLLLGIAVVAGSVAGGVIYWKKESKK